MDESTVTTETIAQFVQDCQMYNVWKIIRNQLLLVSDKEEDLIDFLDASQIHKPNDNEYGSYVLVI